MANRGTDTPRPGEVITLVGGDEAGESSGDEFRLTRKSIENRTVPVSEDLWGGGGPIRGEGGSGALGRMPAWASGGAFEFLMHGLRPTEPCPECGEIPTFGNTMMSLGFHADGPVKGVDGREYTTCPECGDDALEL